MNHSIHAYLERRTTEQLLAFLAFCRQNETDHSYAGAVPVIEKILLERRIFPEGT